MNIAIAVLIFFIVLLAVCVGLTGMSASLASTANGVAVAEAASAIKASQNVVGLAVIGLIVAIVVLSAISLTLAWGRRPPQARQQAPRQPKITVDTSDHLRRLLPPPGPTYLPEPQQLPLAEDEMEVEILDPAEWGFRYE